MTKEATKEAIVVMQAFVDGEEIIETYRNDKGIPTKNPPWDWRGYKYSIKSKPVPATDEELAMLDDYAWFRDPDSKMCQFGFKSYFSKNEDWEIFDPIEKTWQEWSKQ